MGLGHLLKDNLLRATAALPNGAANTTTTAIDLDQRTSLADFVANCELLVTAPVLNTTQQPDAKTLTYDVIHSDNADLSSPVTLIAGVGVQTGAGGAGAAGAVYRAALPTNVKRYVGVKVTGSAAGNSSTANVVVELAF